MQEKKNVGVIAIDAGGEGELRILGEQVKQMGCATAGQTEYEDRLPPERFAGFVQSRIGFQRLEAGGEHRSGGGEHGAREKLRIDIKAIFKEQTQPLPEGEAS